MRRNERGAGCHLAESTCGLAKVALPNSVRWAVVAGKQTIKSVVIFTDLKCSA